MFNCRPLEAGKGPTGNGHQCESRAVDYSQRPEAGDERGNGPTKRTEDHGTTYDRQKIGKERKPGRFGRLDEPCGGVAPNVHVRCSLFSKPMLDAAEELGPSSMNSNQIQISGIAHSNRNVHPNFSSRGTGSCTKRDTNDPIFRSR